MCGFLVLKPGVGSSSRAAKSVKRWFALLPDFVLYAFRTELDERAMTATPLPGYTVLTGAQLRGDPSVAERDRDKIIKMFVQQGGDSIEKLQIEFWLENRPELWLGIPYTNKKSKNL